MVRIDPEEMDAERGITKQEKDIKEKIKPEKKEIEGYVIPRAVSIEEMFNFISYKIDLVLARIDELEKK